MKVTPADWVELVCIAAIGGGTWLLWGFGAALLLVGGIGLSVALIARRMPNRGAQKERTV